VIGTGGPLVDLAGTHLVITGGGSGIGATVALGAAALGAEVLVVGRRPDALQDTVDRAAGALGRVVALPGDVTDPATPDAVVGVCRELWSDDSGVVHVHGLVNAAGVARIGRTEDLSDADFREVLEINLTGSFRMSREIGGLMLAAGHGSIVMIGSLTSMGGFPGRTAYTVSKHGIIGLTKALAAEWGASGVRVNAVSPGFVRTPMTDAAGARGLLDFEAIAARTPLRRRADVDEMVGPVLFLLSDAASFVTGTSLVADGGWTAYLGPQNSFADPRVHAEERALSR
jgi:3-oxoacyl-[acyl-carrier protein] reductase